MEKQTPTAVKTGVETGLCALVGLVGGERAGSESSCCLQSSPGVSLCFAPSGGSASHTQGQPRESAAYTLRKLREGPSYSQIYAGHEALHVYSGFASSLFYEENVFQVE